MDKKQCFKCKLYKSLDLFYQHPATADKHLNKCKLCTKKDVKSRYYNPDFRQKIKEYERLRFQDPKRKKLVTIYQKKRRLTNRGKYRAHSAVNNAIRDGRLIRLPCEVCGEVKSQAHHTDYRKFLDVKWLCFKHHREAHKQIID
jgi:hypothetical protein